MILADENILDYIIDSLRAKGYNFFSIKESVRGATDISIASLSLNPSRIILTEDKDFGEIAFSKEINLAGCILLRYVPFNEEKITALLLQFLENETLESLTGKFVTITPDKIRITDI